MIRLEEALPDIRCRDLKNLLKDKAEPQPMQQADQCGDDKDAPV